MKKELIKLVSLFILAFASFGVYSKEKVKLVDVSRQWKVESVVAKGLAAVDNVVITKAGILYATLEMKWIGQVVKIAKNGKTSIVLKNIDRADGLLLYKRKLYITEEIDQGRVLEYDLKTKKLRMLFRADRPEGIDYFENGDIVVAEDKEGGAILRYSKTTGIKVLIKSMSRPEGICIDQQQGLVIAETSKNRVVRYYQGKIKVLLENINEPDQVECHVDGSVWISEDNKSGRLLRFYKGILYIIAKDLASPQGIAFGPEGEIYLAEQGRSRIIKLVKTKKQ